MNNIETLELLKLVILSESEIKNILISNVMSKEYNNIELAYRLENAANIIHSEQFSRMINFIMDKKDE